MCDINHVILHALISIFLHFTKLFCDRTVYFKEQNFYSNIDVKFLTDRVRDKERERHVMYKLPLRFKTNILTQIFANNTHGFLSLFTLLSLRLTVAPRDRWFTTESFCRFIARKIASCSRPRKEQRRVESLLWGDIRHDQTTHSFFVDSSLSPTHTRSFI